MKRKIRESVAGLFYGRTAAFFPAMLAIALLGTVLPAAAADPQVLPWQREMPLREAAQSVVLESTLNPTNPLPDSGGFGDSRAMTINSLKMRTTLWGPPQRITISLNKNNVWDRRLNLRSLQAPTLQEITAGAFSPANKGFVGKAADCQRPRGYGYLLKEGGFYDGYRQPLEYPMPCMKPVGQIILGIDPLAGATAPQVTQSCASGVVQLQAAQGDAKASLKYVLGMTSNLYAVRGEFAGINTPVWLRLYRHRDTAHTMYMTADGKTYTRPGTEADKTFNAPLDPPTSGQDGRYFWIRQKMPAEKTFPQGFEYVLMGVVATPGKVELKTVEGKTHLGTPPPSAEIAAAPGAAATAIFTPGGDGKLEALVTVVTTMDGPEVLALAKQRLAAAEAGGFDGVVQENTQWWNRFYDQRENGRVFHGLTGARCSDDIRALYRSYADSHGGGTKTDMRQLECSASYGLPERDVQPWTSAPCYNEIFYTNRFVRNWGDSEDMWKQLVWHWMAASKDNARDMFGMPGMFVTHGYLPPVKADKYVHTTITLELCLETMAQIIKPAWDEWDYGGDINYLRKECYPLMREMAVFYAAYAKKGEDGYYHVIPSMEPERWGFYAEFARNKDVISSLCMFRWGLTRAAEAAEVLGVDADLRGQWREVAAHFAPYPTWETAEGPEFCAIRGVEPVHLPGDHFGEAAEYPTLLADEINLDSPKEQRDMMLRTIRALRTAGTSGAALTLLGQRADAAVNRRRGGEDAETLLNSRSGRMHLFPVVAPAAEVAFHNFQARGGFLVSAARNAGGVYYVEVQPRRDNQCLLMNPWPGKTVVVRQVGKTEAVAVRLDKSNGECLVFAAVAGQKYLVEQDRPAGKYQFDGTISRQVLENFLARSISVEGVFNGRGDLDENIRMLKSLGVKYAGRSLCLWGAENNFLANIERARKQAPKAIAADPEMVLEACVFETVGPRVEQIAVPDWVFTAFGQPVEKRNFIYDNIIYPAGQRRAMGRGQVPDVSRLETQMWFYYQAVSYIDAGFEAIHFGQVEIMNRNDRGNAQWDRLLTMVRSYAAKHARRHLVLCNGHTPSGGLVHDGKLLLDFHAFPLRVKENPDKPGDAILQLGFSDGIYNRSKGGVTFSGWKCEHLPYLVELDNYGNSRTPGKAGVGNLQIWGYDEISWFAHQNKQYRADWLKYAWDWVRKTDPNGFLQMPGSRTATTPDSRWYFANNPSPACPTGLGDEDAIRAVWAADAAKAEK